MVAVLFPYVCVHTWQKLWPHKLAFPLWACCQNHFRYPQQQTHKFKLKGGLQDLTFFSYTSMHLDSAKVTEVVPSAAMFETPLGS